LLLNDRLEAFRRYNAGLVHRSDVDVPHAGGCGDASTDAPESGSATKSAPAASQAEIADALASAETYIQTSQFDKADAILTAMLEKLPDHSRVHEMYGLSLLMQATDAQVAGQYDAVRPLQERACTHYLKAAELDPHTAGLQQSAGEIAHTLGKLEEALALYRRAETLDPLDPKPPLYAAQVYLQQDQLEAAHDAAMRVVAIDPNAAFAYATLASISIRRDDLEDALSFINLARTIEPEEITFRVQEARIHRLGGHPARAVELLAGLSEHDRVRLDVASELEDSFVALNRLDDAAEVWERCLRLHTQNDPRYVAMLCRAGQAHLRRGDIRMAGLRLDQATAMQPEARIVTDLHKAFDAARLGAE
jgi:tetratricopeptide (TPR) repeat protein